MNCEVCQKPILDGQGYVYHNRLAVFVHTACPMKSVKGEDISSHTVVWNPGHWVKR